MLDASDVKKTFMDEAAQSFKLATEASQEPEPRRRKGQTNPHLVNTPQRECRGRQARDHQPLRADQRGGFSCCSVQTDFCLGRPSLVSLPYV